MKILSVEQNPLTEIFFQSAGPRGKAETARLPILRGTADGLPSGVTSLLITSDLQGVAPLWSAGGEARLLGEVLAEQLSELEDIPELSRLGVILCGDLFSAPDAAKRGATGDVTSVWEAFAGIADWVVGVQGNHDIYSSRMNSLDQQNCSRLDGTTIDIGGLRVGGVGLIAGNADKAGRRSQEEQSRLIRLVSARCDVLLLHEGPPGDPRFQPGSEHILSALHPDFSGLVIAGHCHWQSPLADSPKFQCLNVDSVALLITATQKT